MSRYRERIIYINKNGKIVCRVDTVDKGVRFILYDSKGNYKQDLAAPFSVDDYL